MLTLSNENLSQKGAMSMAQEIANEAEDGTLEAVDADELLLQITESPDDKTNVALLE
jgi:hypothetical protein